MRPNSSGFLPGPSALLLAVAFSLFQSCYHYRIVAPRTDESTEYQRKTAHSFFWGLLQRGEIQTDQEGNAGGIREIHVVNNLGYSVITVFSFGIWCPIQLEWKHAKPCPAPSVISANR